MADTIKIGDLEVGTATAEAELRRFERALGTTIDRSQGLSAALVEAATKAQAQAAATAALRGALDGVANAEARAAAEAEKAGKAQEEAAQQAAAAAEQAARAQEAAAKKAADAAKAAADQAGVLADRTREAFVRGGLGNEAAEKVKHFADALALARGETERFGGGSVSAGQRFQAFVGAVGMAAHGAIGFATAAVQGVASLFQMAAAAADSDRAIRALGSAYGEVQRQTRGAVTAQEALTEQQQLVSAGVQATDAQLGLLTRGAREFANQWGGTAAEAMQVFNAALGGDQGAQRRLAQFGIDLRNTGSESERAAALFAQLGNTFRNSPPIPESAHEELARYQREWNDFTNHLGGNFLRFLRTAGSGMGDAQAIIEHVNGAIGRGIDAVRQRLAAREQQQAAEADRAAENARKVQRAMDAEQTSADDLANALRRVSEGYRANDGPLENFYRRMQNATEALRLLRERNRENAALRANLRAGGANDDELAQLNLGGGSRRGGGDAQAALDREERRNAILLARRNLDIEFYRTETPLLRQHGELRDHYEARELAHLTAQLDALRQMRELRAAEARDVAARHGQAETERERGNANAASGGFRGAAGMRGQETADGLGAAMQGAQQAQAQSERAQLEANDASRQFARAFGADAEHTLTAAQQMSNGVKAAWDAMTGAAQQHFAALITGRETAAQAFEGLAKDGIASLAEYGFGQMLTNIAAGVTALATVGGAAAAPGFFAAAAAWGAVAALGGAASYAMSGGGSAAPASAGSAASASTGTPASAGRAANDNAGGGNVTYEINVNGALATREDIQDAVREAHNRSYLRGQLTTFERTARAAGIT